VFVVGNQLEVRLSESCFCCNFKHAGRIWGCNAAARSSLTICQRSLSCYWLQQQPALQKITVQQCQLVQELSGLFCTPPHSASQRNAAATLAPDITSFAAASAARCTLMQRWYARDASCSTTGTAAEQPAGCVARLDVDVTAALAAAGSSHALQLWSAEQPSLYVLLIKLAAGRELLEVEGCQVRASTWIC
jgi:hypothetical protein